MTGLRVTVKQLPLLSHDRVQEELRWGFCEAIGALSPASNFAGMVAMIEMGGPMNGRDMTSILLLLSDPEAALAEVQQSTRSAARFARFSKALARVGADHANILRAVYGTHTEDTPWLAFGGAANLTPVSALARRQHTINAPSGMGFVAWAARLAVRVAGEEYQDPGVEGRTLRRPARASAREVAIANAIKHDTLETLSKSVYAYVEADRRVTIGGLHVR